MTKKILVVEDNAKNRILLKDLLNYYGYDVIEAVNGDDGVRMATEHNPDLILMDIQMPVMDGLTALNALKATKGTGNMKIVALTSFAMKGDRETLIQSGFDGYMSKPVDTRELPEVIRKLLQE